MESNKATGVDVNTTKTSESGGILASCRVCTARSSQMRHIFDSEPDGITDRILFCTGVKFTNEDRLPSQICNTCLDSLSIAHKFKTLCLIADDTFRKFLLQTTIKIEELESDDDYNDDLTHYNDDKTEVKEELLCDVLNENAMQNGMLKNEESDGALINITPRMPTKKRGPYNKPGKPKRAPRKKFTRLKCEPCDIKFATKADSDEHKKTVHKNDTYVCEICGKVFSHRASHYTHIRSHLPPQHGCQQCDYKTWHKYDLIKHVRMHTGVKEYQCEYCTASFCTTSNLSSHIKRFHEGVKRFQCTMCDRNFYDRSKLNRHTDSHNDIKRYECDVCHSCFTRRCYWKKHLDRQHGIVVPAKRPGRQKVNLLIGEFNSNSLTSNLISASVNSEFVDSAETAQQLDDKV